MTFFLTEWEVCFSLLSFPPISSPLSLTGKRWILPGKGMKGSALASSLAADRGIDFSRKPSWENLSDPFALGEMEEAVARIRSAIDRKENIGIIGDYDADGITGTAQLVRFFRRHGIDPKVILPHRQKDGYGIKQSFIDEMHKQGVTLFLTVDTGISHAKEIAYARGLKMDVIVTDHHSLHAELPNAVILHPKIPSEHENPCASGSGVAFTLVRALENDEWEEKDIDLALATIGTVADVVPLLGENRTLVQLGLLAMTRGKGAPVFDLARSTMKNGEMVTSTLVGFRIAPRINAAGRLADPLVALRGLLEGGDDLARLHLLNSERQDATQKMMEVAETMIEDGPILLLRSPMFHAGIIGLIAGRLAERYGKPAVIGCEEGETITCSLRSSSQYHIADALSRCSHCLLSFGGHAQAGGCTLHFSRWEEFREMMEQDIAEQCPHHDFSPMMTIDAILDPRDLSPDFVGSITLLEPFGAANPEPRFLLKNQELQSLRQVGGEGRHLQCSVLNTKAIGFGLGELYDHIPEQCDLVCRVGLDAWSGEQKVQLFIEDVMEVEKAVVI